MKKKTLYLCYASMIAALYVALTYLSAAFGLSSGVIQCRISEALCILPIFTPAAIPGVTIGCFLSNILTGGEPLDIVFGTLATLLGALGTYALRRWRFASPWPTVISNTLIIPFVLKFVYGFGDALPFIFLTVGIGEVISAGVFGYILMFALFPIKNKLFVKLDR